MAAWVCDLCEQAGATTSETSAIAAWRRHYLATHYQRETS